MPFDFSHDHLPLRPSRSYAEAVARVMTMPGERINYTPDSINHQHAGMLREIQHEESDNAH